MSSNYLTVRRCIVCVHVVLDGVNVCDSMPCDNGGTCQGQGQGFACLCLADFTGTRCECRYT